MNSSENHRRCRAAEIRVERKRKKEEGRGGGRDDGHVEFSRVAVRGKT